MPLTLKALVSFAAAAFTAGALYLLSERGSAIVIDLAYAGRAMLCL